MKKILLGLVLASLWCNTVAFAQKRTSIKQSSITAKAVASKEKNKPYILDLTRGGTVYTLASDIDNDRLQLHTAKGDVTMGELIKKSGKDVKGKAIVGMKTDIRAMRLGLRRPSGGLNYSCGNFACICTGDDDCNDLFTSTSCGPIAVCYPDSDICICIKF